MLTHADKEQVVMYRHIFCLCYESSESRSVVIRLFATPRTICNPWNFPGQNTGVGSHSLLQGSSQSRDQTQVSYIAGGCFTSWATREALACNFLQLHGQYHGIPQARILEWVAIPFSRGSSQPRDRIQISFIEGWFFTSWATREAPGKLRLQRSQTIGNPLCVCVCVCVLLLLLFFVLFQACILSWQNSRAVAQKWLWGRNYQMQFKTRKPNFPSMKGKLSQLIQILTVGFSYKGLTQHVKYPKDFSAQRLFPGLFSWISMHNTDKPINIFIFLYPYKLDIFFFCLWPGNITVNIQRVYLRLSFLCSNHLEKPCIWKVN